MLPLKQTNTLNFCCSWISILHNAHLLLRVQDYAVMEYPTAGTEKAVCWRRVVWSGVSLWCISALNFHSYVIFLYLLIFLRVLYESVIFIYFFFFKSEFSIKMWNHQICHYGQSYEKQACFLTPLNSACKVSI